jgi:hypothetical protein
MGIFAVIMCNEGMKNVVKNWKFEHEDCYPLGCDAMWSNINVLII